MGWDVEDHTLDVVLSPRIPAIVEEGMRQVVEEFLAATVRSASGSPGRGGGLGTMEWILHPGGAKVVDAYARALGLDAQALRHTSATLRAHGNMSSPTVLFALQRAQAEGIRRGRHAILAALGPGFAAELALLEAT